MAEAILSLPYRNLFETDYPFYSIKQLDIAYQKLVKFISAIPELTNEECIPFNQNDELVWISNQHLKEFVKELNEKMPVMTSTQSLLHQGVFSLFMHVVSQLLITKIRIQFYKSAQNGMPEQFSTLENEINIFGSRIIATLESLKEIEERIKHYLRNHPNIHEFESLYHRAVKAQQEGNVSSAKAYAVELNHRKSKYILATKVIQNDMTMLNQYHSNIQLIHKSILTSEKKMMEQKSHFLSDRMQNLNQSFTEEMNTHQREQILEMLKSQIELVSAELSNIKQRSEVIVIKENQINQTLKQLQSPSSQSIGLPSDSSIPQENPNTWTVSKIITVNN